MSAGKRRRLLAAPAAGEARFGKNVLQAMEARTVQWKLSMA